ncbi:MAG: hypothetical protein ACOYT4_01020 [Nanoarchaeota archaeon]
MVKAQLRIQQMAFMILALFFFFILIGLFFFSYQIKSLRTNYEELQKSEAISSLETLTNMPEFAWTYDSSCNLCVDKDKLLILVNQNLYDSFWPVSSIEFIEITDNKTISCPNQNCNYYSISNSGQKIAKKYSTYITICEKFPQYEKCKIGKIIVGVKDEKE